MASWEDDFLSELDPRRWTASDESPKTIAPSLLFLGSGEHALEVALASSTSRPRAEDVRKMWNARQGRRPSPLLLVVGYPEAGDTLLTVCGPAGESPTLIHGLEVSQVERLAAAALGEPSRHAAVRFLVAMLPEAESDMPGLRNSGLLATQELLNGVPTRHDWAAASAAGKPLLGLSGRPLVEALGFSVANLSTTSSVLTLGEGTKRAVAIFLDEGETFDEAAERFLGTSPVSNALAQADKEGLPWVVLTRGRQIRLYAARPDTGVGRKGRAETFVEVNLALLPDNKAGYLPLLFGADALTEGGTIEDILERSADFSAELATRLRERIYFDTVPQLASAVAARLGDTANLTDDDLANAYEQTLIILFRLMFVAYAEDRDLLPYRSNSKYADHSLKHISRRLAEDRRAGSQIFDEQATDLWEDVRQLWRAVDRGNKGWGVPAYNGGLFADDPEINAAGAALGVIELTDAEFGPALAAMLVDEGTDGIIGPVDFRSLSVREFGTIYEGLLESMLSIAPTDLTTDSRGNYVPARNKSDDVIFESGSVYFHNRSGARKATGSYFTKPFAVEHLLDHALEPALDDHLARVQQHLVDRDDAAAADAFFDFRCVDIAMGSGHFLVAAVDRIEARLSSFLALHPIPAISSELDTLRRAALETLGDLADGVEIESGSLLRRQVARRCIYGVDLNHVSVELARLAIWIHTFVPGLPLSFLDHSLVCGNSLTGIGTLDEALAVLDPDHGKGGAVSLFREGIEESLGRASVALERLAHTTDTTTADIKEARKSHNEAVATVEPTKQLFDLLVALRLGEATRPVSIDEGSIGRAPALAHSVDLASRLNALHFPIAFPEVFVRERAGFDCIIGNPPWEEVMVDEDSFWSLRSPGIQSLPASQTRLEIAKLRSSRSDLVSEYDAAVAETTRTRQALSCGQYPQMNEGNADLYKAFVWRFWNLVNSDGRIGVVLPRTALAGSGTRQWREAILDHGEFTDVVFILNNRQWFFEDVHPQYTIALVSLHRGQTHPPSVAMRGPYRSLDAFTTGKSSPPARFPAAEFRSWSESASFPLLPSPRAAEVFAQLRLHPSLGDKTGSWRTRPLQGDFNATTDRAMFDFDPPSTVGLWPVVKGATFNLWQPDTGIYYGWANPDLVVPTLIDKRSRSARRANSPFHEFPSTWVSDPDTLPCQHPRIAFRDVSRATDTRTVIAALVPGESILTNKAPFLLWPRGNEHDVAYLLGVLCSIPLDWYARRVTEVSLNFHIFNSLPVPRPEPGNRLRKEVIELAGRLSSQDARFANWASRIGVDSGPVGEREDDMLARLDAAVAHLYGLTADNVNTIFETFHVGWDFTPRLALVLEHFEDLS